MKNIFESATRTELVARIGSLNEQNHAQWGKMNAFQMLKHCTMCEDMMQGKLPLKRVFIGRLIGKMILNKAIRDERPFGKNSPTSPVLKTTGASGDFDEQRQEWINRIDQYAELKEVHFVHPFFGPMTERQIGIFAYKHADHHLRQFGV
ncbi:DinB family protein [Flavobacterium sp.]|uniref:DinB family protein n=1 Tax=Flavobacterium sp. TaxID=239 RepID=UPI0039E5A9D0